MGTSGVPWNVPKAKIIESIKKFKGRLTYACEELDCAYVTLQKAIKADPELIALVDELRQGYDTKLLDAAESYLVTAMDQKGDLGNGLKAAFFVLNNKGKERGYVPPRVVKEEPSEVNDAIQAVREINASARTEDAGGSDVAPK